MDKELENLLDSVDRANFDSTPFAKKTLKPWGYEIIFTPEDLPYTGKIIHIDAHKRLSLQLHDKKVESWYLLSGEANLIREDAKGEITEKKMEKGFGYTNLVGQRHRLIGITESDVLEVSTPEIGTTYRLEDDYQRPSETEDIRRLPDRGWSES